VDSPRGVAVRWSGPALVDGEPWPVLSNSLVFLPSGTHTIEAGTQNLSLRLTDFNGELTSAQVIDALGVEISYTSSSRALAVMNRKPVRLEVDGSECAPDAAGTTAIFLPRGQHIVTIHAE